MADHTPTPWERTDGEVWIDARQQVCCGRGYNECCGEPDVIGGQQLVTHASDADATFIVTACNAYDANQAELTRLREENERLTKENARITQSRNESDNARSELTRQLAEAKARESALVAAMKPILKYVSIPESVPDDLWTECTTHSYLMSDEEFDRCRSELSKCGVDPDVALKGRNQSLMLWTDGVTVGEFRVALAALESAALSAHCGGGK